MLSGRFDDDNYPALGTVLQQLGVGQAQFFVNSVDTTTTGLDLTVSHKGKLAGGQLNTTWPSTTARPGWARCMHRRRWPGSRTCC